MTLKISALAALSAGTLFIAAPSALAQNTADTTMGTTLPADHEDGSDEGKWGLLGLLGLAGLLGLKRQERNDARDRRAEAAQRS